MLRHVDDCNDPKQKEKDKRHGPAVAAARGCVVVVGGGGGVCLVSL